MDLQPLACFGPEVTADPGYHPRSLTLAGVLSVPAVEFTDAAHRRQTLCRRSGRPAQGTRRPS